jgi:WD40 repeat protein
MGKAPATFLILILALPGFANTIAQEAQESDQVRATAWSPDGDQIAVATEFGGVQIQNPETGQLIVNLHDTQAIFDVAWSPDGTRLAAAGADNQVKIWNPISGEIITNLQSPVNNIRSISWSPDGTTLAGASQDGFPKNVNVWDVSTGQIVFSPDVGDALAVAWSPDGTTLAIGKFREIQLWDVATQQSVNTIQTPEYVIALAWSPDNTLIASADTYVPENSVIRIWDVATTRLVKTLIGHTDVINSVNWSPIDNSLVSASHDTTVRIWDIYSGQTTNIYSSNDSVFSAEYSPYGGRVAFGGQQAIAGQSATSSTIQIVVPDPSPERLQAIAESCNAPLLVEQAAASADTAAELATFETALEAMPADSIPPACAADLLAIAEAMQGQ